MRILLGMAVGAAIGYFLFYRVIGCNSGSCPITSNPWVSSIYGGILGAIITAGVSAGGV
ncbi:MAG: DUF6132 family protein [Anaerovoracaceae bacterium]